MAKKNNIKIRGYISCAMGCPFEGPVDFTKVYDIAKSLKEMGCYQVALGDTTGMADPRHVMELFRVFTRIDDLAVHFNHKKSI